MKPPITYYGGKTRLARRIAAMLPAHEHYVEPFAGSLAVLFAKAPATHETVNDLDGDLMHFWRMLRERPADLERACALTPHSRAEHQLAYEREGLDDIERARRVWVLLSQGRSGTLRRTGWRHYVAPHGATSMPGYLAGYVDRMAAAVERLARVSLECRPAADVIDTYGKHEGVLLYVDPPYLGTARTSTNYRHEMSAAAEHETLAEHLAGCRATVVLSGYASPLYERLYTGWRRVDLPAVTSQGAQNATRVEVLWSNRPLVISVGAA